MNFFYRNSYSKQSAAYSSLFVINQLREIWPGRFWTKLTLWKIIEFELDDTGHVIKWSWEDCLPYVYKMKSFCLNEDFIFWDLQVFLLTLRKMIFSKLIGIWKHTNIYYYSFLMQLKKNHQFNLLVHHWEKPTLGNTARFFWTLPKLWITACGQRYLLLGKTTLSGSLPAAIFKYSKKIFTKQSISL